MLSLSQIALTTALSPDEHTQLIAPHKPRSSAIFGSGGNVEKVRAIKVSSAVDADVRARWQQQANANGGW